MPDYPRWVPGVVAAVLALVGLIWLLSGPATAQLDSYKACTIAGYPVTDTNPPACDSGTQFFLGPAATPQASLPPLAAQAFGVLVNGDTGGSYPKGQQVITTQAGLVSYWRAVHAGLPSLPPILPVNFSQYNVVALSSGPELTNGYTLQVTGITAGAGGTIVGVSESVPTITCAVANVHSNRYFIVETAKLPTPVTYQIVTTYRQCPS